VGFPSLRITKSGSFSTILNFLGANYGKTTALANCLYSLQLFTLWAQQWSADTKRGQQGIQHGQLFLKFHNFSPGNACF